MSRTLWDAAGYNVKSLQRAIRKYPQDISRTDIHRNTPLDYAVLAGSIEAVILLVDNGAEVNQITDGETAIFKAIAHQNAPMVRVLLDLGADPDIKRKKTKVQAECTGLQRAEMFGDPTIIAMIKEKCNRK